ncbi:hypothetical protein [Pikeienuella sp. HZG-20]|uniref:hypothetical protein n=1 Tax=Paludibacillus litoralis TaxID=3133267 RepID=UPI0030EB2080
MLDATQFTPATDWRQTLTYGDIISFRFPVRGSEIPPKIRPCLVLDIVKVGDARYALLAYGTSAKTRANRGYEVQLGRVDARAAGLHRPTRFVGARRMLVSLDHPDIVICAGAGAPVIGCLSGAAVERMHAVRARIQAEADIVAERRSERRKARRSRRQKAEPRPVWARRRTLRRPRPAESA